MDTLNSMVKITVRKIPNDSYEEVCEEIENKLNELGLEFDFGLGEPEDE